MTDDTTLLLFVVLAIIATIGIFRVADKMGGDE